MGKPTGFKEITRETPTRRPVELRVMDWDEIYLPFPEEKLRKQGARCMDCGIPFCNNGCPLGNQIPDWNDLVYRGRWREALAALEKTNNFPEFTGRICPAPCEEACVLTINDKPVTIKLIEQAIADRGWEEGWIVPRPPRIKTGKSVAVVGSGPAGMAAAQQLCRAGHDVTVFERDDRPGGLLIYGIPDFKMDKRTVDRRVRQMEAEGVTFKCNAGIGTAVPTAQLQSDFDAVLLCMGATQARDVQVPGRDLDGIHLAMTYLPQPTKANLGDEIFHEQMIDAAGKDVIIIGGGDTAADCLGSALRQGARSVKQFDINSRPPEPGEVNAAWPNWPMVMRTSAAHEEGESIHDELRNFAVITKHFSGSNGKVEKLHGVRIESHKDDAGKRHVREIAGSAFELPCDLCLLAIGFTGPEPTGPVADLKLALTDRGAIRVGEDYRTSAENVWSAGDARRGQSLVVWAISEGRQAARCIDEHLMGSSDLPYLPLTL